MPSPKNARTLLSLDVEVELGWVYPDTSRMARMFVMSYFEKTSIYFELFDICVKEPLDDGTAK